MIRTSIALGCITLGAFLGMLLAPDAKADPTVEQDASFYKALTDLGMPIYYPTSLRQQGIDVCNLLDNGVPDSDVISQLEALGYPTYDDAVVVYASAIGAYCPWNNPRPASSSRMDRQADSSPVVAR